MTDKVLLKLAAKAAGIDYSSTFEDGSLAIIEGDKCAVNNDCKKDYCWEWVK